jgi:hypothetical protein
VCSVRSDWLRLVQHLGLRQSLWVAFARRAFGGCHAPFAERSLRWSGFAGVVVRCRSPAQSPLMPRALWWMSRPLQAPARLGTVLGWAERVKALQQLFLLLGLLPEFDRPAEKRAGQSQRPVPLHWPVAALCWPQWLRTAVHLPDLRLVRWFLPFFLGLRHLQRSDCRQRRPPIFQRLRGWGPSECRCSQRRVLAQPSRRIPGSPDLACLAPIAVLSVASWRPGGLWQRGFALPCFAGPE